MAKKRSTYWQREQKETADRRAIARAHTRLARAAERIATVMEKRERAQAKLETLLTGSVRPLLASLLKPKPIKFLPSKPKKLRKQKKG